MTARLLLSCIIFSRLTHSGISTVVPKTRCGAFCRFLSTRFRRCSESGCWLHGDRRSRDAAGSADISGERHRQPLQQQTTFGDDGGGRRIALSDRGRRGVHWRRADGLPADCCCWWRCCHLVFCSAVARLPTGVSTTEQDEAWQRFPRKYQRALC